MNRATMQTTTAYHLLFACLVLVELITITGNCLPTSLTNQPQNEEALSRLLVKRSAPSHNSPYQGHSIMRFGRAPHNIMHFGKRSQDDGYDSGSEETVGTDTVLLGDNQVRYFLVPVVNGNLITSQQLITSALQRARGTMAKKARLSDETDNVFMHFG